MSRILFSHRKILHRDLSINNVLLLDELAQYSMKEGDVEEMCFSDYLLDKSGQGADTKYVSQTGLLTVLD